MCRPKRGEIRSLAQALVETEGCDPERDRVKLEETLSELKATQPEAHHDLAEALREDGTAHRVSPEEQPAQSFSSFLFPGTSTLGMIFPEDQDEW